MKKSVHWLLAASSALLTQYAVAAEITVSNSTELQDALIQAAASYEDDTIVLQPNVFTTNGQPFSYISDNGGSLTIKSADPDNKAILDGQALTAVLRLEHTNSTLAYGETDNTEFSLENLVIQNGVGDGTARNSAGLYAAGAHITVKNSKLLGHEGSGGYSGAALHYFGDRKKGITLSGVVINDNTASLSTQGAVVYIDRASEFTVTDKSLVANNTGNWGIIRLDSSPATIEKNSRFIGNTTARYGVLYPDASNMVQIRSSEFINNETTTNTGSGVLYNGSYQIDDSLFENNKAVGFAVAAMNRASNQYIRNSRFIGNESTNNGIVKLGDITGNTYLLNNSLFANNTGASADSGIVNCNAICEIANNIFVANTGIASVHSRRSDAKEVIVANSVFIGSNDVLSFRDSNSRATLTHNFLDPQLPQLIHAQTIQSDNINNFAESGLDTENDYQILDGSPLIDSGTTDASLLALPTTDIRGNARVFGNAVDIGWEEFGSSNTVPVITRFELLTPNASNLDLLQFRLDYEVADDIDPTLVYVEVKTDETELFTSITLEDNLFDQVMMEGGPHTVTVKVTNTSEGANESASQDLSFRLKTLSAEEVFDRAELHAKALCAENPIDCGIDTDAVQQTGFELGYEDAIQLCSLNPGAEECNINLQTYIDQGYEAGVSSGKSVCTQNPQDCGINVGVFDGTLIPEMTTEWELFGTGQDIANTDLAVAFADAQIVWTKNDGNWLAWSPDAGTRQMLHNNNVSLLQSIPANSGFWVKK